MKTLYGLTANPFDLTPDPTFLYWSPAHQKAFQLFVRNQQRPQGILVVTGAHGTGKTTLLRAFATIPQPRTRIVSLPHAASSVDDLSVLLAQQVRLASDTQHISTPRSQTHPWWRSRVQPRDNMLVLLDNAHEWAESLLAEIAGFARLATPTYTVSHLILAGPLSLPDSLKASRLASLRARITGIGELSPFDLRDTQAYIQHRLTIAGCPKESLFAPAAVEVIYRYTQGMPRVINQLCSQVLLAGGAAHVPRIEAELVQHVATRMGLHAPASSPPAHAVPGSPPFVTRTRRGTAPVTPQSPPPRTLWPSTASQPRGRTARLRAARLTRVLLPLSVMLLMGGSVLRPGAGLQEHGTSMLVAPLGIGRQLPATSEPLLSSGRALEAEADTVAGAGQLHPPAPGVQEARVRREPLFSESGQDVAPSPPAPPLATGRATHLRTTAGRPTLRAPGAVSATSRAPRQRPPQAVDALHLAKTPRTPHHEPASPLAQRGFVAAPSIPTRAEPAAHDTSDALEHPILTRQARRFQDDLPLGAAPSSHGATVTPFRGPASDAPETTPPRLPLSPPTEGPQPPAALLRSPEPPPQEPTRSASHVPTTAEVMARSVPTPSFQGRTVEIHTGLAQTSVLINGAYIGPAPVVLHLPLGVYTMAIDRPGYTQMRWKMQVDPTGVALFMTKSGGGAWPSHYTPRVFAH
jgi:type II secretory pathway predicted ATPase ExeA